MFFTLHDINIFYRSSIGNGDLIVKRAQEIIGKLPGLIIITPPKITPSKSSHSLTNKLSRINTRSNLSMKKSDVRVTLSPNLQSGN